MEPTAIGQRLRIFLETTGYSKAEFSRLVGIKPQSLNRYLSGEYNPLRHSTSLSDLGCSINWLRTGVGGMFEKNREGLRLLLLECLKEKEWALRSHEERETIQNVQIWSSAEGESFILPNSLSGFHDDAEIQDLLRRVYYMLPVQIIELPLSRSPKEKNSMNAQAELEAKEKEISQLKEKVQYLESLLTKSGRLKT